MAVLVDVRGSAPLGAGAMMLVDEQTNIEGSITGGCVEGALVEAAREILEGGPSRISRFGYSDDVAGEVGLTCGGTVTVFLRLVDDLNSATLSAAILGVQRGQPVVLATLLDGAEAGSCMALVGDELVGSLKGTDKLDRSVGGELHGLLMTASTQIRLYGSDGAVLGDDLRVFIHSFAQPPRLIIFGAVDFSATTAAIAKELGYAVTICEPRPLFAASSRYTDVANVVVKRPEVYLATCELTQQDAVLVFTHDPKFDEPGIRAALATNAGYIGALGSRRTARDRERRLLEAGVQRSELTRLKSPCGLDIGASTPGETALAIMSEIVSVRNSRDGASLASGDGPIRPRAQLGPGEVEIETKLTSPQASVDAA